MKNSFDYLPGATPLDPDEIEGLKLKHITTREELNRWEQDNINEALSWMQTHRQGDILTEKFIKVLHKKMFGEVWRWAGQFRKSGKNIGVEANQISVALHLLLEDTKHWITEKVYPADEIAVRFHHKLVWIHLFPNGNGRHARLMTDMLLTNVLKQKPFSWIIEEVEDNDKVREFYLNALRKADAGDYSNLLKFAQNK